MNHQSFIFKVKTSAFRTAALTLIFISLTSFMISKTNYLIESFEQPIMIMTISILWFSFLVVLSIISGLYLLWNLIGIEAIYLNENQCVYEKRILSFNQKKNIGNPNSFEIKPFDYNLSKGNIIGYIANKPTLQIEGNGILIPFGSGIKETQKMELIKELRRLKTVANKS